MAIVKRTKKKYSFRRIDHLVDERRSARERLPCQRNKKQQRKDSTTTGSTENARAIVQFRCRTLPAESII
jgi:hypothetical protein